MIRLPIHSGMCNGSKMLSMIWNVTKVLTIPLSLASIGALLLLACSSSEPVPSASTAPEPEAPRIDQRLLTKSEFSPSGLQAILGTGDLAVGVNRVGFSLVTRKELVTDPEAQVAVTYLSDGASTGAAPTRTTATFRPWPYGSRGLYTTEITFDRPGAWALDISARQRDGAQVTVTLLLTVQEATSAPAVGAPAPRSQSKTLQDVSGIEELSTGSLADPDLYQITIAEAAASNRPTVIVFASPAFCTNEVCGPQVEVLQEIKDRYKGQANFIHVDLYENPQEIQGDISTASISRVVVEWRLPSIEWTFVLDRQGTVAARFEAFTTFDEVQQALEAVL